MADGLYMGIDGGGSKTTGVLVDGQGCVLAGRRVGGCAIVGRPSAESIGTLVGLFESLCHDAQVQCSSVTSCGLGLNGVDFDDEIPLQRRAIASAIDLPVERLTLVNDAIVALWGATPAPAACHWQHGSAFTSAYRPAFGCETVFDNLNAGKAFDIRTESLATVARMIDGRQAPTALMDLMLAHLDVAPADFAEAVFRRQIPHQRMLALPILIFETFEAGEPATEALVGRMIEDCASAAVAMVGKTGHETVDASFGGGVIKRAGPTFWKLLTQRVHRDKPSARIVRPALDPEYGGAVLAAFSAGLDPVQFYQDLITHTGARQ